ncbi:hypothetical protein HYT24_00330 [Candidatus Pacearchaeota archaeon]|nr:hypothetical protein [Candidatus Pacearchaeota archaeon]
MGNKKVIHDFFKNITAEIKIKAEKIGLSRHSSTIGTNREILLAKYFKELMPSFFNYGNGVIIDSEGNMSSQEDLIIYSPFMGGFDNESSLFPVDGVCATVEIKSNLDRQKLKEAFENIRSIKKFHYSLIPKTYAGEWKEKVCCNIFSYDSISASTLKGHIFELQNELKLKDEEMFDNLCVNGQYIFTKSSKAVEHFSRKKGEKYVCLLLEENSISYFIDLIINDMNVPLSPIPLFIKYLGTFDVKCL